MKIPSPIFGTLAAVCVMGAALPQAASAQVSTDDFNALKKMVEQLGEKVQKLEQTHEQDQKAHEQDQQVIQQLQQQLGETKTAVTNAQQTADNVAKVQSAYPPPGASEGPMHNVTMVGDAEVQFGKTAGQHAPLNWPILRRFSCIERATTCSSKRDSTSCSIITRT